MAELGPCSLPQFPYLSKAMSDGKDAGSARSFSPVCQKRGTLCLPQLLQASEKIFRKPFSGVNLLSLLPK